MDTFLQFDQQGNQIAAALLAQKPEASGWNKAPKNYQDNKLYRLVDGKVQAISDEDQASSYVEQLKIFAKEEVRVILDRLREPYAGYSYAKSKAYQVQELAAARVLSSGTVTDADREILGALSEVRGITVKEMATLIMEQVQKKASMLGTLEAFEDQLEQAIDNAHSDQEIREALSHWITTLDSAVKLYIMERKW